MPLLGFSEVEDEGVVDCAHPLLQALYFTGFTVGLSVYAYLFNLHDALHRKPWPMGSLARVLENLSMSPLH